MRYLIVQQCDGIDDMTNNNLKITTSVVFIICFSSPRLWYEVIGFSWPILTCKLWEKVVY